MTGRRIVIAVCVGVLASIGALSAAQGRSADASTESAADLFQIGAQAYERGDFQGAVAAWSRIESAGLADAAVYYNLGNALHRLGRGGEAILAYERALRLQPTDPEIRDNLEFVSSRIVDRVEDNDVAGPLAFLADWHARLPPTPTTAAFLAAWLLFNACLAALLFGRSTRLRRLGSYGLGGALLLVLAAGLCLGALVYRRDAVLEGVVLAARLDLQSVPGEGGVKLTTVHEGLKVRVRAARGGWLEVVLPNGFRGWVPESSVGTI